MVISRPKLAVMVIGVILVIGYSGAVLYLGPRGKGEFNIGEIDMGNPWLLHITRDNRERDQMRDEPTYTLNVSGLNHLNVTIWGAGGGGALTDDIDDRGDGGDGGYIRALINVTEFNEIEVWIGEGGGAGSDGAGGAGGWGRSSGGSSPSFENRQPAGGGGGSTEIVAEDGTVLAVAGGGGGGAVYVYVPPDCCIPEGHYSVGGGGGGPGGEGGEAGETSWIYPGEDAEGMDRPEGEKVGGAGGDSIGHNNADDGENASYYLNTTYALDINSGEESGGLGGVGTQDGEDARVTIINEETGDPFLLHDWYLAPREIDAGETVTIEGNVTNLDGEERSVYADLFIDEELVDQEHLTLDYGETTTVTFLYNDAIEMATYDVRVELRDYNDSWGGVFDVFTIGDFEVNANDITAGERPFIEIFNAIDDEDVPLNDLYRTTISINGVSVDEYLEYINGSAEYEWDVITTADVYTANVTLGSISRSDTFLVEPDEFISVAVTPEEATIQIHENVSYHAMILDQYDNEFDVTYETNWSIEEGAGGEWDDNVYHPNSSGTWEVTGEYMGMTDTVNLTVLDPGEVAYIVVTPSNSTVSAGNTQVYTATAYNQFDEEIGNVSQDTNWSIDPGAGGSWDANVYMAEFVGKWTVNGSYLGLTDQGTLDVEPGEEDHIELTPVDETISAGGSQAYNSTAFDEFGNPIGDVTNETQWSIDADAGGSWEDNVYTSKVSGTWTVTGDYDGALGTADLTVSPGAPYSLDIGPKNSVLITGDTERYTAVAFDEFENQIGDVTNETQWSIDGGAGGSWEDNVYASEFAGAWTVTGEFQEVIGTTGVYVLNPVDVPYIEITPQDSTIPAGNTQAYTAVAYDNFGNEIREVTGETDWSVDPEAGGDWDDNVYTSEFAGTWNVTGDYYGSEDHAELNVETLVSVDHIMISPAEAAVTAGDEITYTSAAYDEFGNEIADITHDTSWSVHEDAGGEWDDNVYTSEFAGTWTVIGDYSGMTDEAILNVTVDPTDMSSIEISPSDSTLSSGNSEAYTAVAYDEFGNEIDDVTGETDWSVDTEAGGYWSDNVYTSEFAGTWTVTGIYEDITAEAALTVVSGSVHTVIISPSEDWNVTAGEDFEFDAEARDEYGNLITDTAADFTWSGAESGVFNEEIAGIYNVTASYGTVTSSATAVTVVPAGVHTVEISPDTEQTILPGETIQFFGEAYDEFGNLITDDVGDFAWTNADAGLFYGNETGEYEVTATYENITSELSRVIVEDPLPYFMVDIVEYDKEKLEGSEVIVRYTIENTGDIEGAQDIVFSVDGVQTDVHTDLILGTDDEHIGTFRWIGEGKGNHTIEVASYDTSDFVNVTILENDTPNGETDGTDVLKSHWWLILLLLIVIIIIILVLKRSEPEEEEELPEIKEDFGDEWDDDELEEEYLDDELEESSEEEEYLDDELEESSEEEEYLDDEFEESSEEEEYLDDEFEESSEEEEYLDDEFEELLGEEEEEQPLFPELEDI
ncbi:MAG: hypothetical protein R6U17_01725 [Thermoplasmata archaeon]